MKENKTLYLCTPREIQHLEYMRELGFGKIEVAIHAGEPKYSIEKERRIVYDQSVVIKKRLRKQ